MSSLHVLLLLSTLSLSQAVTCNPPPRSGELPDVVHCTELVHAILDLARLPGISSTREWGRDLANTPTTVHLPKIYWMTGAGPRTCGVTIDNDAHAPHAVEKFRVGDLGLAAERVFSLCLVRKNEIGSTRLGEGRKVILRLVRVDRNNLFIGGSNVQEAVVGNGTMLMSSLFNAKSGARSPL
ncbi:MAG: hypothetical protein Q9195_003207 [Heterodermia aff. obscurata]